LLTIFDENIWRCGMYDYHHAAD